MILTSATLSTGRTFSFIKGRLGIPEAELLLDSPFEYASQTILYLPTTLPDPRAPDFVDAATETIRQLLELTEGRALVLFTSFRMLHAVYEASSLISPIPAYARGMLQRVCCSRHSKRIRSIVRDQQFLARGRCPG